MKRGILLIAAGHPYYGKMAAALAATLRVCDSSVPIHLAHAGDALRHLTGEEKGLFTSQSIIPDEYFTTPNGKWIRVKMFLNKLSPFDETLYLDSDLLWLKRSPAELFEQLKKVNLTFSNMFFDNLKEDGGFGTSAWVNVADLKKAYGFKSGKYFHLHSELVYFKKSEAINQYFDAALQAFDNLKVKAATFAGSVPDELPFAIACIETKQYPHASPFRPLYWHQWERGFKQVYEIAADFFGVSMASNQNSVFEIDMYNNLASAAYLKLGLQQPYKWKSKNSFLPERKDL